MTNIQQNNCRPQIQSIHQNSLVFLRQKTQIPTLKPLKWYLLLLFLLRHQKTSMNIKIFVISQVQLMDTRYLLLQVSTSQPAIGLLNYL